MKNTKSNPRTLDHFDKVYSRQVLSEFIGLLPTLSISVQDLIRRETASSILGVARQTLNSHIKSGRLATIEIDRITFLNRKEIEAFKPKWSRPDRRALKGKPRIQSHIGLPIFKEATNEEENQLPEYRGLPYFDKA